MKVHNAASGLPPTLELAVGRRGKDSSHDSDRRLTFCYWFLSLSACLLKQIPRALRPARDIASFPS